MMTNRRADSLDDELRATRRVGVPLVALETPDITASTARIARLVDATATPVLAWDSVTGFRALGEPAGPLAGAIKETYGDCLQPTDAVAALVGASGLGSLLDGAVVLLQGMHRYATTDALTSNPGGAAVVIAGLHRLRDALKTRGSQVVLLGPRFGFPPELAGDVLVYREPMPDADGCARIARDIAAAAGVTVTATQAAAAGERLLGLTAFGAEQVAALAVTASGFDDAVMIERKFAALDAVPGIRVLRTGPAATLQGYAAATAFGRRLMAAPVRPPRCVVWIDEIEKAIAGAGTDTSGVTTEMLGRLLTEMETRQYSGMILVGAPGSGKSLYATSLGTWGTAPTLQLDLSACKSSLVGESYARLASALDTIAAVGSNRVFVVATCNALQSVPPELQRRFRHGTWYFPLPTPHERACMWTEHLARCGLDLDAPRPVDRDYVGADIASACRLAEQLAISPADAGAYIVPVGQTARSKIRELEAQADGRWISARDGGPYRALGQDPAPDARRGAVGGN